MKLDPTANANVNRLDRRKSNTLQAVQTLPDIANEGDMVLMEGTLHVRSEGDWHNIDANLLSLLGTLTTRVNALENANLQEALETLTARVQTLENDLETLTARVQALENN